MPFHLVKATQLIEAPSGSEAIERLDLKTADVEVESEWETSQDYYDHLRFQRDLFRKELSRIENNTL